MRTRTKAEVGDAVRVRWRDASFNEEQVADGTTFPPFYVHTVGFLMYRERCHIGIATDWFPNNGDWRRLTIIPEEMVVELVVLEEASFRKT